MGSSNASPVPEGTLGSLSHLWHVLDYVFSQFHFYEVALVTSICARLGMKDFGVYYKITDHEKKY